jgi:membrane-anchored protein YejM (alkaline phosphatase superfamily)
VVGRDLNCNGHALAADPSDADRSLARPAGDPDAKPGEIDLALLISIDCLATDAFTPAVMPRLVEYARRGVVFSRLYAAGSRTHLTLPLLQRASDRATPVSMRLADAGVVSTAVLGYFDHNMGDIVPGFRVLNLSTYARPLNPEISGTSPLAHIEGAADATAITNRALDDLREHDGKPHYLWLHYFDTHWPYRTSAGAERLAAPPGRSREMGDFLTAAHHIDAEIGRLLDQLDKEGRLAHAVVIITADHGEGFGRHNIRYHGVSAYEMLVHVPGFVIAPGLAPGRYEGLVSHRDIPPTLLGAFGQVARDPSAERFGRSWLRLRAAPRAPLHRFVVTRSSRAVAVSGFVTPMAAIIEDQYKMIVTFEDNLVELYDVRADPEEREDLASDVRAPQLRRALEIYRDIDGYP